ncbi:hypothetical protein NDK43_09575 [Neobacillus pocheonensis]|uniref:Uncharacterized protein n=1 Tax=Neobacillus pocheonensis TaxID=363869 RepID=A0ABT0W8D2_9BACI|nr:hypothetical protein [Neobacillus pocheonensis]
MWNQWRATGKKETWFLPLALVCTVVFEISVVWKYPTLRDPLSIAIGILTLLALICLLFVQKLNAPGKRGISIIAIMAGVLALVAAPTAWA